MATRLGKVDTISCTDSLGPVVKMQIRVHKRMGERKWRPDQHLNQHPLTTPLRTLWWVVKMRQAVKVVLKAIFYKIEIMCFYVYNHSFKFLLNIKLTWITQWISFHRGRGNDLIWRWKCWPSIMAITIHPEGTVCVSHARRFIYSGDKEFLFSCLYFSQRGREQDTRIPVNWQIRRSWWFKER